MKKIFVVVTVLVGMGFWGLSLAEELPKKNIGVVGSWVGQVDYFPFNVAKENGVALGWIHVMSNESYTNIIPGALVSEMWFWIDAKGRIKKVGVAAFDKKGNPIKVGDLEGYLKDPRQRFEANLAARELMEKLIQLPDELASIFSGAVKLEDKEYRPFLKQLITEVFEKDPFYALAVDPREKLPTVLGRVKSDRGEFFVQKKRVEQEILQARKERGVLSLPARDQAKKRRGIE